jgi:hypothetical protein
MATGPFKHHHYFDNTFLYYERTSRSCNSDKPSTRRDLWIMFLSNHFHRWRMCTRIVVQAWNP